MTATGPPNLGDVIQQADVSTKGTGSYAADYVNWARTAHLLHQHAPGWQFHLLPSPDGLHAWKAPNGTAYVVGYFTGPENEQTALFPQAVMDNRNAPIQFDRVSARDLTDTHRRCLCAAAAATFGLAWQLWAKEPLEDPLQRGDHPATASAPAARQQPPADLLARAARAVKVSGLTEQALTLFLEDKSSGEYSTLQDCPAPWLEKLATRGVAPADVKAYNQKAEALTVAADDEPPATWAESTTTTPQ